MLVAWGAIELALQGIYFYRSTYAYRKARLAVPESRSSYTNPDEYYGKYDSFPQVEFHSFLTFLPKRNHQGHGYATNGQHLRYDEDLSEFPEANEFRVLVTGGSAAWGAGVRQDQTFSRVAETALRDTHAARTIRVVTSAVGFHKSTHERIWIHNRLADLHPDVIVMFSGWNDIYDGYHGAGANEFRNVLRFEDILAREVPQVEVARGVDGSPPHQDDYWLKTHYFVRKALYRMGTDVEAADRRMSERMVPPAKVVRQLVENIHAVVDLGRRRDFELVFCLQPSLYNTSKSLGPYEQQLLQGYRSEFASYADYNRAVYDELRRVLPKDAAKYGYAFLDADEAIAGETRDVFADHVHFGDRGNRYLGEYLAEALDSRISDGRRLAKHRTVERDRF